MLRPRSDFLDQNDIITLNQEDVKRNIYYSDLIYDQDHNASLYQRM